MSEELRVDVCVIGGGMAGISAAAEIAGARRVVLLEREAQFGSHATGRSAALFAASYGNEQVRALTRASGSFYLQHELEPPLTQPRGALFVAGPAQAAALAALETALGTTTAGLRRLDPRETVACCPALRESELIGAVLDPTARDIDVAATQAHFLRQFRARGGQALRDAPVLGLERGGGEWRVRTPRATVCAPIVVNAAGAWADEVAALAAAAAQRLTPCRRTAVRVAAGDWAVAGWPCVIDVDEQWYFRPDAGALLLSPADETPSAPCDAQPEDLDIALAIDRVEQATRLTIGRPLSSWAGLRTFAPDRTPVVGFDRHREGFFWLAGQGGYGIQSAPALARLTAALVAGQSPPADLVDEGVDPQALRPGRASASPAC